MINEKNETSKVKIYILYNIYGNENRKLILLIIGMETITFY